MEGSHMTAMHIEIRERHKGGHKWRVVDDLGRGAPILARGRSANYMDAFFEAEHAVDDLIIAERTRNRQYEWKIAKWIRR